MTACTCTWPSVVCLQEVRACCGLFLGAILPTLAHLENKQVGLYPHRHHRNPCEGFKGAHLLFRNPRPRCPPGALSNSSSLCLRLYRENINVHTLQEPAIPPTGTGSACGLAPSPGSSSAQPGPGWGGRLASTPGTFRAFCHSDSRGDGWNVRLTRRTPHTGCTYRAPLNTLQAHCLLQAPSSYHNTGGNSCWRHTQGPAYHL